MIGDIFMWLAIKSSSNKNLPLTVSIIHTVPVFSLLLVWLVYKEKLNYKVILGIFLTIIGVIITIFFNENNI